MIIFFYAAPLIFIMLLICFTGKYKKEITSQLSAKEYPMKFLYGTAFYIIDKTKPVRKKIFPETQKKSRLKKKLEQLYVGKNVDNITYLFYAKRITYMLSTFTLLLTLGLLLSLQASRTGKQVTSLSRDTEDSSYTLEAVLENNETKVIDVNLDAKTFYYETVLELFEKYRTDIVDTMLADNPSISEVSSPLNFISTYGDEGLTINWEIEDENLIDYSGEIHRENVGLNGTYTNVTALLSIGDYSTSLTIPLLLVP